MAPGAIDGLDFATWQGLPETSKGQPHHAHNRLISVAMMTHSQREVAALGICERLNETRGPTKFILPLQGFDEWDRSGGPLHDAEGHAIQVETLRKNLAGHIELIELDAHINDDAFVDCVLEHLDTWIDQGIVPKGVEEHS